MGRPPLSESGCRPTLGSAQRYASLVEPGVELFRRFDNPSRRVGDPRHRMGDEGKAAGRVPLAALPSLWSITATFTNTARMSALGQKQKFRSVRAMSALPPKADIAE